MVDVVAHHFLREDENDVEHGPSAVASGGKGFLFLGGEATTVAHDGESGVLEGLQLLVGHVGAASQSLGDGGIDLHGIRDVGVSGDAVVALMFDVDSLPNDGEFFRVEGRVLSEFVKNLIAFEKTGGFGHHGVEVGDHTEAFE